MDQKTNRQSQGRGAPAAPSSTSSQLNVTGTPGFLSSKSDATASSPTYNNSPFLNPGTSKTPLSDIRTLDMESITTAFQHPNQRSGNMLILPTSGFPSPPSLDGPSKQPFSIATDRPAGSNMANKPSSTQPRANSYSSSKPIQTQNVEQPSKTAHNSQRSNNIIAPLDKRPAKSAPDTRILPNVVSKSNKEVQLPKHEKIKEEKNSTAPKGPKLTEKKLRENDERISNPKEERGKSQLHAENVVLEKKESELAPSTEDTNVENDTPRKKMLLTQFLPADLMETLSEQGTKLMRHATGAVNNLGELKTLIAKTNESEEPEVKLKNDDLSRSSLSLEEQPRTSVAVAADGSNTGYFAYEIENNRMILLLRSEKGDIKGLLDTVYETGSFILVPQDISLESVELTDLFLHTHLARISQFADADEESFGEVDKADSKFESFSGVKGRFSKTHDEIEVIHNPYESSKENSKIQVLREGQIHFGVRPPIGILLISEPLWIEKTISKKNDTIPISPRSMSPVKSGELDDVIVKIGVQTDENDEVVTPMDSKTREMLIDSFKKKINDARAQKTRLAIRRFIRNFKKKPPPDMEEKSRLVNNFLASVNNSLTSNPLWKGASKDEINVSQQCLLKIVVTQLHDLLFSSEEEKHRDVILKEKIDRLWFITPEHLDIKVKKDEDGGWDDGVWHYIRKELSNMNNFSGPREKLEALLNSCKIIIFLLNAKGEIANADDFLPHMILSLITTNPPNLISNIEFIKRLCPKDLPEMGEAMYYLTLLESAVYFIENLNGSMIGVSEEDFDIYMKGGVPASHRDKLFESPPKKQNISTMHEIDIPPMEPLNIHFDDDSLTNLSTESLPEITARYIKEKPEIEPVFEDWAFKNESLPNETSIPGFAVPEKRESGASTQPDPASNDSVSKIPHRVVDTVDPKIHHASADSIDIGRQYVPISDWPFASTTTGNDESQTAIHTDHQNLLAPQLELVGNNLQNTGFYKGKSFTQPDNSPVVPITPFNASFGNLAPLDKSASLSGTELLNLVQPIQQPLPTSSPLGASIEPMLKSWETTVPEPSTTATDPFIGLDSFLAPAIRHEPFAPQETPFGYPSQIYPNATAAREKFTITLPEDFASKVAKLKLHFAATDINNLITEDIPFLLKEYKQMAELMKQIQTQIVSTNQAANQPLVSYSGEIPFVPSSNQYSEVNTQNDNPNSCPTS